MSYIHVPSCRDYWRPSFGNKLVQETMSVNHFEKSGNTYIVQVMKMQCLRRNQVMTSSKYD
jgi:hypothetical protein